MDLQGYELPEVHYMDDEEYYLDPIRKKFIKVTPEETVRQIVLQYLMDELEVPIEMLHVEEILMHYDINSKDRADIVIDEYDELGKRWALAVVECKAENVPLANAEINQALDYGMALMADYVLVTNGHDHLAFKKDLFGERFLLIEDLPSYEEMTEHFAGEYVHAEAIGRTEIEDMEDVLDDAFSDYWVNDYCGVCCDTPMKFAVPALNFSEMLEDEEHRMPVGNYGSFELKKDLGVIKRRYGNSSGGSFYGNYRSFLVEYKGDSKAVSLGLSGYYRKSIAGEGKTAICVAVDDDKVSHHSLQMVLEDHLKVVQNKCFFTHNASITISKYGSGKRIELLEFVKNIEPHMVIDKTINLGNLEVDELWYLDDKNVAFVIGNLIAYALFRDDFRAIVKERRMDDE